MRNLKSKNRVALYGRHSTSKQNAASSDDQIRAGERYAAQQGWTVVAEDAGCEDKARASTDARFTE